MNDSAQPAEDVREELARVKRTLAALVAERGDGEEKLRMLAARSTEINGELESLTYTLSHDLRGPLRSISSFAGLLRRSMPDDNNLVGRETSERESHQFVEGIWQSAQHCERLVDAFLAYLRQARRELNFNRIDMNALCSQVVIDLAKDLEHAQATVRCGELPEVVGDAACLRTVVTELILNALKFKRPVPPEISVSCEKSSEEFVFAVRDNGVGFEMHLADRLFLPFQRLYTSKNLPGVGIGLAICRRVIARHSGRMWVESEINSGSTFYFTLPSEARAELLFGQQLRVQKRPGDGVI